MNTSPRANKNDSSLLDFMRDGGTKRLFLLCRQILCLVFLFQVTMAWTPAMDTDANQIEIRWVRKLLADISPTSDSMAADGSLESATWISTAAGIHVSLSAWNGATLAGSRNWGANSLVFPSGKNWAVALQDWRITRRTSLSDGWVTVQNVGQDAQLRLAYLPVPIAELEIDHGTGFEPGVALPVSQIILSLPFRRHVGGGTRWQTDFHAGTPIQAGIWQVPPGLSLAQAQAQGVQNRLADLGPLLREIPPQSPVSAFDFRLLPDGHWTLVVDIGSDGEVDIVLSSNDDGHRASDFTDIGAAPRELIAGLSASMGAANGIVAKLDAELTFTPRCALTPPSGYDHRPLLINIPQQSPVDPLRLQGQRWADRRVQSSGGLLHTHGRSIYLEVPLNHTQAVAIDVWQEGNPPTHRQGEVVWAITSLDDSTVFTDPIRLGSGDRLALQAANNDKQAQILHWRPSATEPDLIHQGLASDIVAHRFIEPGRHRLEAFLDLDEDGYFSDYDELSGELYVDVFMVDFDGPIACEVGFKREKGVDIYGVNPDQIVFVAADPSALEVSVKEFTGYGARLYIRALRHGPAMIEARLGSVNGPLLAAQQVNAFVSEYPHRHHLVINANNGMTEQLVRIRPYVPNLTYVSELFAGRAAFEDGGWLLQISTNDFSVSTDSQTGELIGEYTYTIAQEPGAQTGCFRSHFRQSSKHGSAVGSWVTINASTCRIKLLNRVLVRAGQEAHEPLLIEVESDGGHSHPAQARPMANPPGPGTDPVLSGDNPVPCLTRNTPYQLTVRAGSRMGWFYVHIGSARWRHAIQVVCSHDRRAREAVSPHDQPDHVSITHAPDEALHTINVACTTTTPMTTVVSQIPQRAGEFEYSLAGGSMSVQGIPDPVIDGPMNCSECDGASLWRHTRRDLRGYRDTVTIRYTRWLQYDSGGDAGPDIEASEIWRSFFAALTVHEEEHRRLYYEHFIDLIRGRLLAHNNTRFIGEACAPREGDAQTLAQRSALAERDAARTELNEFIRQTFSRHENVQTEYDRVSNHGATQKQHNASHPETIIDGGLSARVMLKTPPIVLSAGPGQGQLGVESSHNFSILRGGYAQPESLRWELIGPAPAWMSIHAETGRWTGLPPVTAQNYNTGESFSFAVKVAQTHKGYTFSGEREFSWQTTRVPDPIIADPGTIIVQPGQRQTVQLEKMSGGWPDSVRVTSPRRWSLVHYILPGGPPDNGRNRQAPNSSVININSSSGLLTISTPGDRPRNPAIRGDYTLIVRYQEQARLDGQTIVLFHERSLIIRVQ